MRTRLFDGWLRGLLMLAAVPPCVPAPAQSGDYRFSDRWRFSIDLDGLAGGPGRLIDLALKLDYRLDERWQLGGGYRMLEGGADTDDVYNFAWLHYAVLDIRYRF